MASDMVAYVIEAHEQNNNRSKDIKTRNIFDASAKM